MKKGDYTLSHNLDQCADRTTNITLVEDYKKNEDRFNIQYAAQHLNRPFLIVQGSEDDTVKDLLYAGTELGLFVSLDGGLHWQSFQGNLPLTPITDLKVHQNNLIASTSGVI